MEIKNGKKPLSAKRAAQPTPLNMDDIFGNLLGLDPALIKCLEKANFAHRFINAKHYADNGNFHVRGWRAISRKELKELGYDTMSASTLTFGSDADGFFRRGDNVLAVRPMELHKKHRAYLDIEAQRGKRSQQAHAEELRKYVKSAGLDMKVLEGYEDETEETDS
jgi:hypothetical protein